MYLDPGFGAILIQFLIGVLISIPALGLVFRHRLVSFYRKLRRKDSEEGD